MHFQSVLTHTRVFPRIPRYSRAFPRIPAHSHALLRIPARSHAIPRIPMHSHTFPRIPMHSYACWPIPTHSPAFPCISGPPQPFLKLVRNVLDSKILDGNGWDNVGKGGNEAIARNPWGMRGNACKCVDACGNTRAYVETYQGMLEIAWKCVGMRERTGERMRMQGDTKKSVGLFGNVNRCVGMRRMRQKTWERGQMHGEHGNMELHGNVGTCGNTR